MVLLVCGTGKENRKPVVYVWCLLYNHLSGGCTLHAVRLCHVDLWHADAGLRNHKRECETHHWHITRALKFPSPCVIMYAELTCLDYMLGATWPSFCYITFILLNCTYLVYYPVVYLSCYGARNFKNLNSTQHKFLTRIIILK